MSERVKKNVYTVNGLYTVARTGTVGKKELCVALGWSRPKLDKRLKTDPKFPIVSRGDQSGGWAFDPDAVNRYLDGRPPPPPIDVKQLEAVVAPPPAKPEPTPKHVAGARPSAQHQGEATARQRKDLAAAQLAELKLATQAGELVSVARMRQISATVAANYAAHLDQLAGDIVKRQNLPVEMEPAIQAQIDDFRRNIVADMLAQLENDGS